MTFRETITAFVHSRISPLGGKGAGDVPPSSLAPTKTHFEHEPIDQARAAYQPFLAEQMRRLEEIRKAEGQ